MLTEPEKKYALWAMTLPSPPPGFTHVAHATEQLEAIALSVRAKIKTTTFWFNALGEDQQEYSVFIQKNDLLLINAKRYQRDMRQEVTQSKLIDAISKKSQ